MILLDTFCASRGPKSLGEQLFHPHWLHISPPMRQQHANPCTKVVILTITTTNDDDTQWSPHYRNTTLILIPTDPATSPSKLGLIASSHKSTIYQTTPYELREPISVLICEWEGGKYPEGHHGWWWRIGWRQQWWGMMWRPQTWMRALVGWGAGLWEMEGEQGKCRKAEGWEWEGGEHHWDPNGQGWGWLVRHFRCWYEDGICTKSAYDCTYTTTTMPAATHPIPDQHQVLLHHLCHLLIPKSCICHFLNGGTRLCGLFLPLRLSSPSAHPSSRCPPFQPHITILQGLLVWQQPHHHHDRSQAISWSTPICDLTNTTTVKPSPTPSCLLFYLLPVEFPFLSLCDFVLSWPQYHCHRRHYSHCFLHPQCPAASCTMTGFFFYPYFHWFMDLYRPLFLYTTGAGSISGQKKVF